MRGGERNVTRDEDPRVGVARRGLALAWTYYSVFLATVLGAAALLGDQPHLFGLPRWVALACLVVPAVFVIALIPVVELLIPDIPLSDGQDPPR